MNLSINDSWGNGVSSTPESKIGLHAIAASPHLIDEAKLRHTIRLRADSELLGAKREKFCALLAILEFDKGLNFEQRVENMRRRLELALKQIEAARWWARLVGLT